MTDLQDWIVSIGWSSSSPIIQIWASEVLDYEEYQDPLHTNIQAGELFYLHHMRSCAANSSGSNNSGGNSIRPLSMVQSWQAFPAFIRIPCGIFYDILDLDIGGMMEIVRIGYNIGIRIIQWILFIHYWMGSWLYHFIYISAIFMGPLYIVLCGSYVKLFGSFVGNASMVL